MRTLKKQISKQDVLTLALERIRHIYDLFDHVAVSFSGGKDSTVVFNLALQVARERKRTPLRVFHFDEEAIPLDVEDYLRRMAKIKDVVIEWYCVPIKHRNACDPKSPYWVTWDPTKKDLWCRPMPPEAITEIEGYSGEARTIPEISSLLFPPELGRCCMLLGIRAQESMTRYRAVSARTDDNYIIQHAAGFAGTKAINYKHVYKGYPIYDWNTEDVWTAPKLLKWDYCKYYDLMEMLKIPPLQQRLAPPFGEEPFQSLYKFSRTYPELWEKMIHRVPGANTAALYSKTGLYGFGDLPEKPADKTWEEFLLEQINHHDPHLHNAIKKRINDEIRKHFRKTSDPILDIVPHWRTGLSWNFLLTIAVRADTKGRRLVLTQTEAAGRVTKEQYNDARKAYEAGLSEEGTRY